MKKLFLTALLLAFGTQAHAQKKHTVVVTNPHGVELREAMVEVDAALGNVVTDEQGVEIPSQVTYDGKLIFQPLMGLHKKRRFFVRHGTPQEYPRHTFGRAYPERYDDFAWENDRVAFRIYGAALKPIDGPSGGIDAWYKRTDKLVLDRWYARDLAGQGAYHLDHGEGLDDYKVGPTLGAGGMAPLVDGHLRLPENYERAELLESGALRTTFKLWYAGGDTRTISIDAGSRLTRIVQEFASAPERVAAGFPMREGMEMESEGEWLMVREPDTELSKKVFLGLVIDNRQVDEGVGMVDDHFVLAIPYKGAVTYYTGYGWGLARVNQAGFVRYLKQFDRHLKNPLKVRVK